MPRDTTRRKCGTGEALRIVSRNQRINVRSGDAPSLARDECGTV